MSKISFHRIVLSLLIAAALIELTAFLIRPFEGYDSPYHIFWIIEWNKLWHAGIFYPRWMPDYYMGYGAPTFYFYPPLAYIFSSIVYQIAPSFDAGAIAKIVAILSLIASGFSMWLYLRWRSLRSGLSKTSVLAGTLLYMFAPYHFFDYATRAALSEHVALIFIPFAFWGMEMLLESQSDSRLRTKGIAMISFSVFFLLVSNIPAAACMVFALLAWALFTGKDIRKNIPGLAVATICAFFFAGLYIIPLFAFRNNIHLAYLWGHKPFMESSALLAIFTKSSLGIIAYNLLSLAGAAIMLYGFLRNSEQHDRSMKRILMLIIIVQLPLISYILFFFVFPFTIIQIPGRLFIILIVLVALRWQEEWGVTRSLAAKVVIFWSICMIPLSLVHLLDLRIHALEQHQITDARNYATGWTTQYGDSTLFLHVAASRDSLVLSWTSDSTAHIIDHRGIYADTVHVESSSETKVALRRTFWSEWKAAIDGKTISILPDSLGRLSFNVPSGNHTIISSLEESSEEKTGLWISGGSLILALGIFGWKLKKKSFISKILKSPKIKVQTVHSP